MVNVWSNLTEQPILAIQSGTCANVVAESTRCIRQCVQDQMRLLDNRARALATSGNFELAFKDVARIQQLVPSSGVGYLCAGHVYSLQGRQKAAIDIYDQGLAAVPLSDPSRQQLVEAQSMAQERDNTRIDFIKEFPIDIIEHIAPWILSQGEMKPREIQEYLNVSHVWRERLLTCIQDLHYETMTDDGDLLGLIAPYCTALTLRNEASWLRQFTSGTPFPSLRVLNILRPLFLDFYDDDEDDNSGLILDAILSFQATTLTHLTIFVEEECDIPFGDILRSCPHLVDLNMTYIDTNMSTAPTCCPDMKSLSFMIDLEDEIDMDDITKRFPELERFMVAPFYYAKDLRIIQNNCPKLKVIGSSQDRGGKSSSPRSDDDMPPLDDSATVGVRTFSVKDDPWLDDDNGVLEYVMEFMKRNSHALQHICLYASPPVGEQQHLGHASYNNAFVFNRLTSYTQQIRNEQHLRMASMVARNSPHLKKLDLYPTYTLSANVGALFDDLVGLCKLESAIVKLTIKDPLEDDMGGIERFIQYHSTIDSQLHTLILPHDVRLSNDALDALTALPQLQTLGLNLPLVQGEDTDGEKIARFIQKLGIGCPQLQHLSLSSNADHPIPDIVFVRLSNLKVKSLRLFMPFLLMNEAPSSLLTLMECPHLQELHIYPACNAQNTYIRGALESKIPSVAW